MRLMEDDKKKINLNTWRKKMKKLLAAIAIVLISASTALAGTYTAVYTISGNGTATMERQHVGQYLFQVEVIASTDDAVTIKIETVWGTDLIPETTTSAATGGEFIIPAAYYAIVGTPTITTTNVSGGNVQLKITTVD
jgi:hypothetical protein